MRLCGTKAALKARSTVDSFATTHWSSRSPYAFGDVALKFALFPVQSANVSLARGPNYVRDDLARRLELGDIVFIFKVQLFVNEEVTPIENGVVNWDESVSPFVYTLGQLIIPRQEITSLKAVALEDKLNGELKFDPYHTSEGIR